MKKFEFLVHFPNPDDMALFRISALNQGDAWRELFSKVSCYDYLNSALIIEVYCVE